MKLLSAVLLSLLPAPVMAGLLYHESFNCEPGEDALVGCGNYAATTNPAGADADIVPGSFSYTDAAGNTLHTSGHSVSVDTADENGTISNIAPLFLGDAVGNTIWISLIGRQTEGTTARFFNVSFRAPDNTIQPPDAGTSEDEVLAIGMSSAQETQHWRIVDRALGSGYLHATSTTPTTEQVFALVRVELDADGSRERYTLWINPLLDRAPVESEGFGFTSGDSDFASWTDIRRIRLAAGFTNASGPSSSAVFDEIRIGDTPQDVMPFDPPTLVLVRAERLSDGSFDLEWTTAPGRHDIIEWSEDLRQWHPYTASGITGVSGIPIAVWQTPVPAPTLEKYFVRVRRDP